MWSINLTYLKMLKGRMQRTWTMRQEKRSNWVFFSWVIKSRSSTEIICPLAVFVSFVLLRTNRIIFYPNTDNTDNHWQSVPPSSPFIIIVLQTEVCLSGGDLVSGVRDLPGAEPLHGAQHPPHPTQQVQTGQDGDTQPVIITMMMMVNIILTTTHSRRNVPLTSRPWP